MKLRLLIIVLLFCDLIAIAQTNSIPVSGNVGIGTLNPTTPLDVRGTISTPEIAFRNADGSDDSDPYRLRKVQSSSNVNWLELQINDDFNESFRIYGNSCVGFGCGVYSGNLYHSFDASGNAYHQNKLAIGLESYQQTLNINGGIGFSNQNSSDKKLYSPVDGLLEWMTHPAALDHGFALSNQGDKVIYFNTLGNSYLNGGNVGIGTSTPAYKLDILGIARAQEVKVNLNAPGPDYVFNDDYQLTPLSEIQSYIKANKHLPEVPSAKEMEANGINLSEMNMLLLKKVEELTLHLIEKDNKINILEVSNLEILNSLQLMKLELKKIKENFKIK